MVSQLFNVPVEAGGGLRSLTVVFPGDLFIVFFLNVRTNNYRSSQMQCALDVSVIS